MELNAAWSHVAAWPDAGAPPTDVEMVADDQARRRIADLLELPELVELAFVARLTPWLDGLRIEGRIEARAMRLCGISLEPFEETVSEPVLALRLPPGSANLPADPEGEGSLELPQEDPPEAGGAAGVDLGVLAIESLALALDPFPRKPGVTFDTTGQEAPPSPFAALAGLKLGASPKA